MATEVVMPQMGESIAEGTIVRWIKKVGDPIDKDEPLFEISTDKVDAEIPSPGAGVLLEIKVKEGETVPVNSVVALIGAAGEKAAAACRRRPLPHGTGDGSRAVVGAPAAQPAAAIQSAACSQLLTGRDLRRPPTTRQSRLRTQVRRRSSARSRRNTASTSRS